MLGRPGLYRESFAQRNLPPIRYLSMAELTVYNKTLEWEIFRVSSAKWGKLSRLHTDFLARALITRIANRQGHVQSQTGCRLLVIASM